MKFASSNNSSLLRQALHIPFFLAASEVMQLYLKWRPFSSLWLRTVNKNQNSFQNLLEFTNAEPSPMQQP